MGADLSGAQLHGAKLTFTQFQGANLSWAHLEGVDLFNVDSLAGVRWFRAFLDRTRIRRDQLGDAIGEEVEAHEEKTAWRYRHASETYLLFKNNFNSIGRYPDAAWAHVKEQRMEKAALKRELDWRKWHTSAFSTTLASWLLNLLWDSLTGYGETPQKPLSWAAGLAALLFPLVFWAVGALPGHGRAFTSSSPSHIDWAGWGDSLIFSLTSFGTLSFSRLQPEGTLPNLIAAFEAMIGVLLFALFVFTLGNRMSRS